MADSKTILSDGWILEPLTYACDADRVLSLALRASDYIQLETGALPDAEWVKAEFASTPPALGPKGLLHLGISRPNGHLGGIVFVARGYETAQEWYLGLVMLDPADRGKGLGRNALDAIVQMATDAGATSLKVAALKDNPKGRKFWEREGFSLVRQVPPKPGGDGHMRHVMQRIIKGNAT
ncbi:GNAT family N-acetyltransferase [Pseudogemmobacter sp. W21_MBD1_M6]|uniref:GNAT family N-acetyltransferase n=1 Tax=Pseudogemmobacter sp. W21_MBD1_M6 TaxID=3240271 RepID=UPI003F9CAC7B